MSKNAIRFAGGLRNLKGSGMVPYLGLLEQVRAYDGAVRAKSALMISEPVVSANAAVFDARTGEYIYYYGGTDNVSVARVKHGVKMTRVTINPSLV